MAKKKNLPKSTNAVDRINRTIEQMEAASKVDPMPPAKPPGRGSPQFVLRYSPEMRDKIARLAKANGRSINAELIALLEAGIDFADDDVPVLPGATIHTYLVEVRAPLDLLHEISHERQVILFTQEDDVLAWATRCLSGPQDAVCRLDATLVPA